MTACVTPKRDRVPLVWGLFAQIQLHLRSQNCVYIFFFSFLRKKSYVKTKSKAISPDFDLQISIYHIYIQIYHGSKPHTRSKISEISQWQKCFSELKISNPRISCTLNGVRRSS